MTHFTCPHCGKRASTDRTDIERVDLNGEPAYFIALPPGEERHVDQRLACATCYARADGRPRDDKGVKTGPHPYGTRYHREKRLGQPVGVLPPDQQ